MRHYIHIYNECEMFQEPGSTAEVIAHAAHPVFAILYILEMIAHTHSIYKPNLNNDVLIFERKRFIRNRM